MVVVVVVVVVEIAAAAAARRSLQKWGGSARASAVGANKQGRPTTPTWSWCVAGGGESWHAGFAISCALCRKTTVASGRQSARHCSVRGGVGVVGRGGRVLRCLECACCLARGGRPRQTVNTSQMASREEEGGGGERRERRETGRAFLPSRWVGGHCASLGSSGRTPRRLCCLSARHVGEACTLRQTCARSGRKRAGERVREAR